LLSSFEHVSHIRLAGDMNNNPVERLHGTRREREKILRGMKVENYPDNRKDSTSTTTS